MSDFVLRDALQRQNEVLRHTIAVVDQLTAVALAGADIAEVTDALAMALGSDVMVFDRALQLLGSSGRVGDGGGPAQLGTFHLDAPDLREVVSTVRDSRLPLRVPAVGDRSRTSDCVIAPIAMGELVLGYLVVGTGASDVLDEDLELVTVQHAASIYALSFVQAERDSSLRTRYRQDLVEGLLVGRVDGAQAAELARLAGLDPATPYLVIALELSHAARDKTPDASSRGRDEELLDTAVAVLEGLDADLVAIPRTGGVTVLLPAGAADVATSTRRVGDVLRQRIPEAAFVLGASRPVVDPEALRAAEVEARRAMAVARRLGIEGEVTSHERLGVHRLLLHVPADELASFANEVLGGLRSHDAVSRAGLLETLSVFLEENANLRRTAQSLFVHVNTVSYRLRRIESISGLSLSDSEDRLVAALTLEVLRVLPDNDTVNGERTVRRGRRPARTTSRSTTAP